MALALVFLLPGLGLLWVGVKYLRPSAAEMEEFLTGQVQESRRPAVLEAAGPILGLVGTVSGILMVTGGILLALLQL